MKKYSKLLLWWVTVLLVSTGIFWSYYFGLIQHIWQTDITYITSMIAVLFVAYNVLLGWVAYKQSNAPFLHFDAQNYDNVYDMGWFLSEIMMALGMLGTVIGLIYMLSTSFVGDITQMQSQLGDMWKHMGLALYTNAVGILGSIILKLEVYFIGYKQDEA